MIILTMPTTPGIRRCQVGVKAITMATGAPEDNLTMTQALPAWHWVFEYELPPMKRAEAEEWCAFLVQCNGRDGRFYGGDPARQTPIGGATGTPLVVWVSSDGETLLTNGWTVGTALVAGDYVGWETSNGGRALHLVVSSVSFGGTLLYNEGNYNDNGYGYGDGELTLVPPWKEAPDIGTTLTISAAKTILRLDDDEQAAWDVDDAMVYGMRFRAEEAPFVVKDIYVRGGSASEAGASVVARVVLAARTQAGEGVGLGQTEWLESDDPYRAGLATRVAGTAALAAVS